MIEETLTQKVAQKSLLMNSLQCVSYSQKLPSCETYEYVLQIKTTKANTFTNAGHAP